MAYASKKQTTPTSNEKINKSKSKNTDKSNHIPKKNELKPEN